jgi:hypothetical protein
MNTSSSSSTQHHSNATVRRVQIGSDALDKQHSYSPTENRMTFVNNLKFDIIKVESDGVPVLLPRMGDNLLDNNFTIRKTRIMNSSITTDLTKRVSLTDESSSRELQLYKEEILHQTGINFHRSLVIPLEYVLTSQLLVNNGGSFYHRETNTLLVIADSGNSLTHPFSIEGIQAYREESICKATGVTYHVDIVDNLRVYGPRFILIHGRVSRIDVVVDVSRESGIYVTRSSESVGVKDLLENTSEYYPLSEESDKKAHLYRRREDAEHSLIDISKLHEAEIAKLNRENSRLKAETTSTQYKNNLDEAAREPIESKRARKEKVRQIELDIELKARAQAADIEAKARELAADIEAKANAAAALIAEKAKQAEFDRIEKAKIAEADKKVADEAERRKDFYEARSYERKDSSEGIKLMAVAGVALFALWKAVN